MGPLFNPIYWALGLAFLLIATVAAIALGVFSGLGAFLLLRKSKGKARRIGLPIVAALMAMPIAFCLTLGGLCNWSLGGAPSPRREPTRQEMVGRYVAEPETLEAIDRPELDVVPPTIELREDGTFRAVNLPVRIPNGWRWGLVSGSGSWGTGWDSVNEVWEIDLDFATMEGDAGNRSQFIDLIGSASPYHLVVWVNYDAGEAVVFERQ
jgi:hypothetical protein